MVEFSSPIGNKKFQGAPMKEVSVPDESEFAPSNRGGAPRGKNIPFDPEAFREFQARMLQGQQQQQQQQQQQPQSQPNMYAPQQSQYPQHVTNQQYQQFSQDQDQRDFNDIEAEIREAKLARRKGRERLSEGARKRIEILIDMTRLKKTIVIDNTVFVLQNLQSKELRAAVVAAAEFDGTPQLSFETSKQLLARSLIQISNVDINEFLNSEELEDKLNFIEELPQPLYSRLYNEYVLLDNEAREKYAIKSPEDAQGVVEDLKK